MRRCVDCVMELMLLDTGQTDTVVKWTDVFTTVLVLSVLAVLCEIMPWLCCV